MDCIFCKIGNKEVPSKILFEDDSYIAFLDQNQETLGHTLIVPKTHYNDITEIDNYTLKGMYDIALTLTPILMKKLGCTGISYLINYGDSQEVKHVHLHLLPDYLKSKSNKTVDEVYDMLKEEN